MTDNSNSSKIYFPNLDPLRFLAAFMIIILHGYEAWIGWWGNYELLITDKTKELTTVGKYIDQFIKNFNVGVDIFFLLSGFLITYILILEKEKTGKIALGKFYLRRLLRIWPLYFLLVATAPFLVEWMGTNPKPDYLSTALFLNNFHAIQTNVWVYPFAHFWSICIEEHFYLFWPLIIAFIPNKKLPVIFSIMIFASAIFRIYVFEKETHSWFPLYLHTLSKMDILIIGGFLAYFHAQKPFKINISPLIRNIIYLSLVCIFCFDSIHSYPSAFLAGFKNYLFISIIAFALLNYNFNPGANLQFKPNSIIHYLGRVSYGIYMYGNIVLIIAIEKIIIPLNIYNFFFYWGLVITLSIVVPIISYELFEKHFLKIKNRFSIVQTGR